MSPLYLLVLVILNLDRCPDVLAAWEEAGVPGATILESAGLRHLRAQMMRDDLPLFPSLRDLLRGEEAHSRTLFALIDDEAVLQRVVDATQAIVGELDQPDTGIMFVLPVIGAWGLRRQHASQSPG